MSEEVERRLLVLLDHPTESPYGNPIPALDELGDPLAAPFLQGVINIASRVADETGPVEGTIRRLGEPVQFEPELLSQLMAAGVVPGAKATMTAVGSYVLLQVDGHGEGVELPNEVAAHIYVAT